MWAPFLVDALAPYPRVRIVLSTSWVRHLHFSRACRYLPEALRHRVIGATWHSSMARNEGSFEWDRVTRYAQIARYVQRSGLEHWIAIDDDDEGWAESARARLVHSNPWQGLSDPKTLLSLDAAIRCAGG